MATAKVEMPSTESATDPATRALRAITSPDRKRKQRTPDSLDRAPSRGNMSASRSSGYNSNSPPFESDMGDPEQRYTSAQSSNSASASGTAVDSNASSRGGAGEETLTLRRREANRLAAQRFRSRKKGYQDSLEERIKILEDEKEVIGRRLAQTRHQPTPDDGYYRPTEQHRRRSQSPDRAGDGDVRLAALESANRRLQDELRGVVEDNDRLRDEVERWRKWEREQREPRREEVSPTASTDSENAVLTFQYARGPPTLPPLDFGPMAPPSYTSSSQSTTYPPPSHVAGYPPRPPHPPLERSHSYTQSYLPPSPGPRLPPLRMPTNGPMHASPHSRPLLPRPESMERIHTANQLRPLSSPNRRD